MVFYLFENVENEGGTQRRVLIALWDLIILSVNFCNKAYQNLYFMVI